MLKLETQCTLALANIYVLTSINKRLEKRSVSDKKMNELTLAANALETI